MTRRLRLPMVLLACSAAGWTAAPTAPAVAAGTTPAGAAAASLAGGDGLTVLSVAQLDARLLEITVGTAALPGPAKVRILLPAGYDSDATRHYPVLYLLHGTSGGAADWTTTGDAQATTDGLPLIVVMPDIALNRDGGGWCTNWVNGGAYGQPEWETFHIHQLIPWVDQHLRTVAARGGRAIAGLSQGGFCSMSYAARHSDLFSTALSYSGAPDIAFDADAQAGSTAVINATEVGLDHVPPDSMFGDRSSDEINWADHDPATLAENLRGMNLLMYAGNGLPGPLDPSPNPYAMTIEGAASRDTQDFHNRLDALGIPNYEDMYGAGTHEWPYWARDLHWSIGPLMNAFAHPAPPPQEVTYTTADPDYSVYGWSVTMHRTAEEFSALENAGVSGFAVAGSGTATVLTPGFYAPGSRYAVSLRGESVDQWRVATADARGRLLVSVPLGPPNPYQQDTAQAMAAGTAVYTTTVSIRAYDGAARRGSGTHVGLAVPRCVPRRARWVRVRARGGVVVRGTVNGHRARVRRSGQAVLLSVPRRRLRSYRIAVVVRQNGGGGSVTLRRRVSACSASRRSR